MNPKKDTATQVQMLNTLVSVRLQPSPIHGVGVFAIREIKKGEKLYADNMPEIFTLQYSEFNKLRPEVSDILLERWPLIVRGSAFVYPDSRYVAYMNHSDVPNYDAKEDRALTDIHVGEEVTEDYRKIEDYQKVHTWLT